METAGIDPVWDSLVIRKESQTLEFELRLGSEEYGV